MKKAGWAEQTRRTPQDLMRRRLMEIYRDIQRRNQVESWRTMKKVKYERESWKNQDNIWTKSWKYHGEEQDNKERSENERKRSWKDSY